MHSYEAARKRALASLGRPASRYCSRPPSRRHGASKAKGGGVHRRCELREWRCVRRPKFGQSAHPVERSCMIMSLEIEDVRGRP
jgi:hypothetical protein